MAIPENRKTTSVAVIPFILPVIVLLAGCDIVDDDSGDQSFSDENGNGVNGDWLIPADEIMDGGPGQDGIPSIDDPVFSRAVDLDYVDDQRLVVGIKEEGEVRAYPHQVLDFHEIVNDEFGDKAIAVTHCPLTGTGIGWNRAIKGSETEFGVSGMLFRNNLIAYDRDTGSYWPQMQLRAAAGERQGVNSGTVQVVETTWETWKSMYPSSEVLTVDTGFERNYEGFAYESRYLTDDSAILFPISHQDDRLPNKQRVHGIIADTPADESASVTVYVIEEFEEQLEIIEDTVGGEEYIIAGSSGQDFVAAFKRESKDGSRIEVEPVTDSMPIIMEDEEGNRWDIFGVAQEGPRSGERLTPARSYTGYFFAWADFFPELEIYEQ